MKKIVLHIPHSSLYIPAFFYNRNLSISKEELNKFNFDITDLYTDELFSSNEFESIIFKYSRVFCDIEKFADDTKESMSKYGMGAVYTKTNKRVLIANNSDEYKKYILNNIYYPYHKNMTETINNLLEQADVIMIDCHSFSKEIIMTDLIEGIPDICIGINNDQTTSSEITKYVLEYFQNKGYKVKLNYPYSGTMIPNNIILQNNFFSLMIEVNKNLYLDGYSKGKQFNKLQEEIKFLLCDLSSKF